MRLLPRAELYNITVSTLHAEVLVAWRAGGHVPKEWPPYLVTLAKVKPCRSLWGAVSTVYLTPRERPAQPAQHHVYMC